MKLLIDMNLSHRWIPALAASGIDAVHWSQVGAGASPDDDILLFALQQDYVVLTRDLDFGNLLAALHLAKPSVIQLRIDVGDPANLISRIVHVLDTLTFELDEGAMVTVDPTRTRVRMLPFA